jgi:PAS domain S-box-containing protein
MHSVPLGSLGEPSLDAQIGGTYRAPGHDVVVRSSPHREAGDGAMPVIVWAAGPDGRVLHLSREWSNYTGLGIGPSLGDGWKRAIHPEDLPAILEGLSRALRGVEAFELAFRICGGGGRYRLFRFVAEPVKDDGNRVIQWLGSLTCHDEAGFGLDNPERPADRDDPHEIVGRLPRSDGQLLAGESEFRATFDNAAVGVAHVGIDGRWIRVNDRLCDIVGYGRKELLGLIFQEITHPDDLTPDLAQFASLLRGEIATYRMRKRYYRKDGELIWVLLLQPRQFHGISSMIDG